MVTVVSSRITSMFREAPKVCIGGSMEWYWRPQKLSVMKDGVAAYDNGVWFADAVGGF